MVGFFQCIHAVIAFNVNIIELFRRNKTEIKYDHPPHHLRVIVCNNDQKIQNNELSTETNYVAIQQTQQSTC